MRPRDDSFARPNPKAARYAHHKYHGIFEHEQRENERGTHVIGSARSWRSRGQVEYGRLRVVVGRQIEFDEIRLEPIFDPTRVDGLFVEETANDYDGRHHVENGEDANAHHELLELVGLVALVFHDHTNAE